MAVRSVPEGYSSVTPYLIVAGAADAIDFYSRVFGAKELMRFDGPDGPSPRTGAEEPVLR